MQFTSPHRSASTLAIISQMARLSTPWETHGTLHISLGSVTYNEGSEPKRTGQFTGCTSGSFIQILKTTSGLWHPVMRRCVWNHFGHQLLVPHLKHLPVASRKHPVTVVGPQRPVVRPQCLTVRHGPQCLIVRLQRPSLLLMHLRTWCTAQRYWMLYLTS